MPALHASLLEACRILDLEAVPELYVRQSPVANAYTMAVVSDDRRPFIVVNSCLLDLLTPAEVRRLLFGLVW
jgi:Zn-dependent protease with chaperone function